MEDGHGGDFPDIISGAHFVADPAAAQAGDAFFGVEQVAGAGAADEDQDFGFDQFNMTGDEGQAAHDFSRAGFAIAGRAPGQDV